MALDRRKFLKSVAIVGSMTFVYPKPAIEALLSSSAPPLDYTTTEKKTPRVLRMGFSNEYEEDFKRNLVRCRMIVENHPHAEPDELWYWDIMYPAVMFSDPTFPNLILESCMFRKITEGWDFTGVEAQVHGRLGDVSCHKSFLVSHA